ncbi:hypothetical protein [Halosimplex sp. J119]
MDLGELSVSEFPSLFRSTSNVERELDRLGAEHVLVSSVRTVFRIEEFGERVGFVEKRLPSRSVFDGNRRGGVCVSNPDHDVVRTGILGRPRTSSTPGYGPYRSGPYHGQILAAADRLPSHRVLLTIISSSLGIGLSVEKDWSEQQHNQYVE